MNCDKCGHDVPRNNDAVELEAILGGNPLVILGHRPRHLLPVQENGEVVCEGSPSRAQYLEGQPRDTRGYKYFPEREQAIREAYAQLQEEAATPSVWDEPDPLNEVPDRAIHNAFKSA